MDKIIQELQTFFQQDSHLQICNNKLTIKETGVEAKLREVIINNLTNDSFSIKLDVDNKQLSSYFNPHFKNIHKGVDAVIFTKYSNKYYLLFLEMKSTTFSHNDVAYKFKSSTAFMKYTNSLLQEFSSYNLHSFEVGHILCYLKKSGQKSNLRTPQSLNFELEGKNSYPSTRVLEIFKSSSKHFEFSIDKIIQEHRFQAFSDL